MVSESESVVIDVCPPHKHSLSREPRFLRSNREAPVELVRLGRERGAPKSFNSLARSTVGRGTALSCFQYRAALRLRWGRSCASSRYCVQAAAGAAQSGRRRGPGETRVVYSARHRGHRRSAWTACVLPRCEAPAAAHSPSACWRAFQRRRLHPNLAGSATRASGDVYGRRKDHQPASPSTTWRVPERAPRPAELVAARAPALQYIIESTESLAPTPRNVSSFGSPKHHPAHVRQEGIADHSV